MRLSIAAGKLKRRSSITSIQFLGINGIRATEYEEDDKEPASDESSQFLHLVSSSVRVVNGTYFHGFALAASFIYFESIFLASP